MDRCSWCGTLLVNLPKVLWWDHPFSACSDPCAQKIEAYVIKISK